MKRGSALLIVLGMTAFMVISAVAFSAFMRYSRLPSSYLRRTSSSRHIVKAALAEAIDQIDIAIGDDPFTFEFNDQGDTTAEGDAYPNNGYDSPRAEDTQKKIRARRARRNYWRGHCFIGTNSLVYAGETISTLTLEGLAYLPPALINEARYYSRHSVAGRWHSLGFDVGRYAYCAVDVSDHIDVNRVLANMGRNSSDRGRITLAHVFENHGSAPPVNAAGWDTFMKQFLEVDDIKDGEPNAYTGTTKLPLISLADLNLAVNKQGWMQMTPFCDYVVNQKNDYISSAGPDSEIIRQMAFVTDSYFPNTNTSTTAKYDLCYSQPFRRVERNAQMNVDDIMGNNADMMTDKLLKHISDIDKIALYDYLDENDIPASLALPSVERVPMVCGIQPQGMIDFEVKQSWGEGGDPTAVAPTAADPETKTFEKVYAIDNTGGNQVMLSGLFLYPFRRDDAQNPPNGKFDFEYAVRLGFCDITTGNDRGPGLRTNKTSPFVVQNKDDFNGGDKRLEGGVIKLWKKGKTNFPSSKVDTEDQAVYLDTPVDMADFSDKLSGQELFKVKYVYHKVAIPNSDPPQYKWDNPEIDENATPWVNGDFFPLAADGTSLRNDLANKLKTQGEIETRPFLTVTVRVMQGNKVVDLAPASMADDQKYNDVNNAAVATMQEFGGIGGIADNGQQPVVTISDASKTFKFGESGTGRFQAHLKPVAPGTSFICPDPRWNFAPENFGVTSDALQGGNWFISLCGTGFGNGGRDNDVFMACSNQGYMQSPSELAFLPRTIDDGVKGNSIRQTISGDIWPSALEQKFGKRIEGYADGMKAYNAPSDIDTLLHGAFMWRTYRPYPQKGFGADELYEFGVTSDGTGYRVNPYSASDDILMAALANTPYSWWAASTNSNSVAFEAADNASTFNSTYAFSEKNDYANVGWDDLKKVAAELKKQMRNPDGDWGYGYDEAWTPKNDAENAKGSYRDYLCGVRLGDNTCDLYEVDRKMLYGFWRDSFAAKQQLFLIFVRAEPMMMGGGAVGQTPPQLGARAVALVWRDPTPTPPGKNDVGRNQPRPHRTRVLFYRQFD